MKVLMLGWEFPPHISGGLGTACAGLTQALEQQQIDVLFVLPKLHGEERATRTAFISASSIPIRQKRNIVKEESPQASGTPASLPSVSNPNTTSLGRVTRTTIEIPSPLSPYNAPLFSGTFDIERWNYAISTGKNRTSAGHLRSKPSSSEEVHTHKRIQYEKKPYRFSGAYGSNLLEEVKRYAQAVGEIARDYQFDIIHAHDWMTYKAGLEAKRITGKPLVLHVHATEIDRTSSQVNPDVFEIEKQGMQSADKVVTVSQWTKDIAIQHYRIPASKIEVIHNGINPKSTSRRSGISAPLGSQIITFLGRITHQKGPMYFVEAARKVNDRFPEAHFVVAGAGDQLPLMIERIAQLRLSNRFHFTGFLRGEETDRVWEMSSVYVMPSVSEPFGIAPLEAIQAGVPVILSKQSGVSEVMPHAIKVDFWNTEAFAEAICNLLRHKSLANTLKRNGAEEIKNITWEKAAKKLTTLYYELRHHYKSKERYSVFSDSPTKKTSNPALF